jgi:hypothetical protein
LQHGFWTSSGRRWADPFDPAVAARSAGLPEFALYASVDDDWSIHPQPAIIINLTVVALQQLNPKLRLQIRALGASRWQTL